MSNMLDERNVNNEQDIISRASHSLIVGLLNNPSACDLACGRLEPNDFNIYEDKMIYTAILDFKNQNKSLDLIEISKYVESITDKKLLSNDVYLYLHKLTQEYSNVWDISPYIRTIEDYNTEVALQQFSNELQNISLNPNNADEVIARISSDFNDIINRRKTDNLVSLAEVVDKYLDNLKTIRFRDGNTLTGTDTGFTELNAITNGWQPGDMIVLAARPSIGKTALALNFLLHAAETCDIEKQEVVVIFSLEMSAEQLVQRMISIQSNITSSKLRTGNFSDTELYAIEEASANISNYPIMICDNSNISIFDIQSKLQQLSKTHTIKLVVVDYLQLIEYSGQSSNRANEVAKISRTLKIVARNINAPIIAIAQLSRKIEERKGDDKKPMLSDLRESGSIEQDADIVTFIDYDRTQEEKNKNGSNNNSNFEKAFSSSVIVDFYIAKHRNGATGMINLFYKKDTGSYVSYKNSNK